MLIIIVRLLLVWTLVVLSYTYISTYTHAYPCRMDHNDTIITSEDFFRKICTCHFIVRVRKGYSRFYGERELETEQNCYILTPALMAVSVVSFSFSRAAQPEAQGPSSQVDDGFLYCILSPTGLQNSIGGPESPFGRVWLSLPHLVSNYVQSLTLTSGRPRLRSLTLLTFIIVY